MTDKRIREVNIKETEDGYTIELKGDKDVLHDLIFSSRLFGGFGRRGRGRRREHGRHRHGKRGEHRGPRRRFDLGPWFESEESPKGEIIDDDTATI
jgi:hypothetical protein